MQVTDFKKLYTDLEDSIKKLGNSDLKLMKTYTELNTDDLSIIGESQDFTKIVDILLTTEDQTKLSSKNKRSLNKFIKKMQQSLQSKMHNEMPNALEQLSGLSSDNITLEKIRQISHSPESMNSILESFDSSNIETSPESLENASKMLNKVLNLNDNNVITPLIDDLIKNMGSSFKSGGSFSEVVKNLSNSFGEKMKNVVKDGHTTQEDLEKSSKEIFGKISDITGDPLKLLSLVTDGSVNGDAGNKAKQEAEKMTRRTAMKEKWRKQLLEKQNKK